jgi:tetratricopeptide (TPR) repeat protein
MPHHQLLKYLEQTLRLWWQRWRYWVGWATAADCLGVADRYVHQQNYAGAITLIRQVLHQQGGSVAAYDGLAVAYQGRGNLPVATWAIAQAIQLDPTISQLHQRLGRLHLEQGQFPQAIAALQSAIDQADDDAGSLFYLGEALVKDGCWDAAAAPLARSIQLNPLFPWPYYYLVEVQLVQGDLTAAQALAEQFVRRQPALVLPPTTIAQAAHRVLDECAARLLAGYQQRVDRDGVIALGTLMLPITSDPATIQAQLAQAYHGQGDLTAAITAIQAGLQVDHQSAASHQLLGQLYLESEQFTAAIAALEIAVGLDANNCWAQFYLGEALVKHGRWAAATAPLLTVMRLNPTFAWSYYYLAEAKLAQGDLAAAQALAQQAHKFDPEPAHLQQYAAYVAQLLQQATQLATYIQQAQARDAQGPRSRPRVLMITPVPSYPPTSGGVIRMFHHMQALQAQTDLVIASRVYGNDVQARSDLAPYAEFVLTVDASNRPTYQPGDSQTLHGYASEYFRQLLVQLSQVEFDIVVTEFIYMAQYRDVFPQAFHVLSEHNIESQLTRRQVAIQPVASGTVATNPAVATVPEADRLMAFETQMWPQFQRRYVVSELDRQQLMHRCAAGETLVVSNGADTQAIALFSDHPVPRVLLMGTLNYFPNVDGATFFVDEILPHIWQVNAQVEFWIAGAKPLPEVNQLAQRDGRIKVIANPAVMADVAQQCCLSVVPLRSGGGTRIKILQSLAMGLPTITTSLGCEGLQVEDGQHLLIRDQPQDFAAAIVDLLADPAQRDRLRQAGRTLVEQQYDWHQIFQVAVTAMLAQWQQWHDAGGTPKN